MVNEQLQTMWHQLEGLGVWQNENTDSLTDSLFRVCVMHEIVDRTLIFWVCPALWTTVPSPVEPLWHIAIQPCMGRCVIPEGWAWGCGCWTFTASMGAIFSFSASIIVLPVIWSGRYNERCWSLQTPRKCTVEASFIIQHIIQNNG
jgi:hypothetical protein